MGALHPGHLSLIQRASQDNQRVVVSIFINPLQFAPQEDLASYPQDLQRDLDLCASLGVDGVFAPSPGEFYGYGVGAGLGNPVTQVQPRPYLMQTLCARSRPTHFQGVATVVTKLLGLIQPDRVYFGQKDAQQLAVIRALVQDLNLGTEVIACPIVRDTDGLALSSRNRYLNPAQRQQAPLLHQSLQAAQAQFQAGQTQAAMLLDTVRATLAQGPDLRLDYGELVDPDTLQPLDTVDDRGLLAVAAWLGSARLIDNVILARRGAIIALDGPAGAGKSTVTRRVAAALGLLFLDTGAMYRAVAWLALDQGVDVTDEPLVAELLAQSTLRLEPGIPDPAQPWDLPPVRVWVNDQEVTEAIRTPAVTRQVSQIAAQPAVRSALVRQQQAYGRQGGLVAEGRDMGTTVFPEADLKVFLTASIAERARRRQEDLRQLGQGEVDLGQLEAEIADRDRQDSSRAVSPLRKAPDAVEVLTDGLTIEEVTDKILALYHQRCRSPSP